MGPVRRREAAHRARVAACPKGLGLRAAASAPGRGMAGASCRQGLCRFQASEQHEVVGHHRGPVVDRDDDGMGRRVHTEPDHLFDLFGEDRIV